MGFHKTEADNSLFVSTDKTMFIAVYVDDLLLFGADGDTRIHKFIKHLSDRFKMTDLGDVSHYLGMEIDIDLNLKTVTVKQSTCLGKILERYGMSNCTPVKIPLNPGIANPITTYESQADKSTIFLVSISSESHYVASNAVSPQFSSLSGSLE